MANDLPSEVQIDIVVVINIITSSISLLLNLMIIMWFVSFDKVRQTPNKVILYWTLSNLIFNIGNLFGFPAGEVFDKEDTKHEQPIDYKNNIICEIQGYLIIHGMISIMVWVSSAACFPIVQNI